MKNAISQLMLGVSFLAVGGQTLLRARGLKRYALIPFLIDLAILFYGMAWGAGQVSALATQAVGYIISAEAGVWYGLVYYPLLLMFWLVFVFLLVFVVYLVAGIVASPFNSLLAERTLMHLGVIADRPFRVGPWLKLSAKMLVVSILKSLLFVVVGLVLFVLAFVPGFNVASSFGAMFIMAFDSMDYSFEVAGLNLRQRLGFVRNQPVPFSGMALMFALTIIVPGLTLLLMPLAVVGAAVTYGKLTLKQGM